MESVGQLAGGIAHDFNNILMVIQGYTDLTAAETDLSVIQSFQNEVRYAAERGTKMMRQLLAFSRHQVVDLIPVDLCKIVRELHGLFEPILPANISVGVEHPGEALYVLADSGTLEQAIMNLVINARDAMPDGGNLSISIASQDLDRHFVHLYPWAREGRFLTISVADSGAGISADMLEAIFEPFFTTKPVGKGTGLGLAMVYGTVKQLDGFVHVESTVGTGTEFRIYLPRVLDSVRAEPESAMPISLTGTETILVIEDNSQVRELATIILRRAGYRVLSAGDGESGLEQFNACKDDIQLILLDVVMPTMGGEQVMELIRAQGASVAILFTTGYSGNPTHTEFILRKGLDILAKPYGASALTRKVRDVLDKNRTRTISHVIPE